MINQRWSVVTSFFGIALLTALLTARCVAQEPTGQVNRSAGTVWVFDDVTEALRALERGELAQPPDGSRIPQPLRIVPGEVLLDGNVSGNASDLTVRLVAVNVEDSPANCVVGLHGAAVVDVEQASENVQLAWDQQDGYVLRLPGRGKYECVLRVLLPVLPLKDGGSLTLNLPGAPVTRLSLRLGPNVQRVQTIPATPIDLKTGGDGKEKTAEIFVGTSRQITVRWSEEELAATASPPRVAICNALLVPDSTGVTSIVELTLRASEPTAEWELTLPDNARLVNLEQPGEVRYDWLLVTRGGRAVLRLTSVQELPTVAVVRLTLRYPYASDETVVVSAPEVAGVIQFSGVVRLRLSSQADVFPLVNEHLLPVDPALYAEGAGEPLRALAWTITGRPFRLVLQHAVAPRQLLADAAILVSWKEGRCDVALIADVEADRPFQDLAVLTPEGAVQLDVSTEEESLVSPSLMQLSSGLLPDRVRIKFVRPKDRVRVFLRYTLPANVQDPARDVLVVTLPQFLGVHIRRADLFLASEQSLLWMQDSESFAPAGADERRANILNELTELLGAEPGFIRQYSAASGLPSVLKLHLARPSLPRYVEATVQLELQRGVYLVRETFTVTPAFLLSGGLRVRVPESVADIVQWPRNWEVHQVDTDIYHLSPPLERSAPQTVALSWQQTWDGADSSFIVPIVEPLDFDVAWTTVEIQAPPDLEVRLPGLRALSSTQPGAEPLTRWVSRGLLPVITCRVRRLNTVEPPPYVVLGARFDVRLSANRTTWRCRWLVRPVRESTVVVRVPPQLRLKNVTLSGTAVAPVVSQLEPYRLAVRVPPQPRGEITELAVFCEGPEPARERLVGWLTLVPPVIEGAGESGSCLWRLELDQHNVFLFPGVASRMSLTFQEWLGRLGFLPTSPTERFEQQWNQTLEGASPASETWTGPVLVFHGGSLSGSLAVGYMSLPLLEGVLWAIALTSSWILVVGSRRVRSLVIASTLCLALVLITWDPVTAVQVLRLSTPGLAAGGIVGVAHRWLLRYFRRREFVHAFPDTAARPVSPELHEVPPVEAQVP